MSPDLDHVSPNNWLNDTLWLGLAYHTWRAPLLVNSNWWLLFASDPKDTPPPSYKPSPTSSQSVPDPSPKQDRPSGSQGGGDEWLASHGKLDDLISFEEAVRGGDATAWQIRRAAWMAHRFAQFRAKLQR
jgi:carnitine O-acetyltransferase